MSDTRLAVMRAIVGLLIFVAAASGCSESNQCRGELDDVGATCPATYDGTVDGLPDCPGTFRLQRAFRCGDLVALVRGGGFECYYDMSSHQLVGAMRESGYFCGDASSDITAGHVATSCEVEPFALGACSSQP